MVGFGICELPALRSLSRPRSICTLDYTDREYVQFPLGCIKHIKTIFRITVSLFSKIYPLAVRFDLSTFMHAKGLIVDFQRSIIRNCFGGRVDRCVDVLVSLPKKDRVREARLSFVGIYVVGPADNHAQN